MRVRQGARVDDLLIYSSASLDIEDSDRCAAQDRTAAALVSRQHVLPVFEWENAVFRDTPYTA